MRSSKSLQHVASLSTTAWIRDGLSSSITLAIDGSIRQFKCTQLESALFYHTYTNFHQVFMQAAYSSDNSLTAWGHLRITPGYTAKVQTQISPSQGTMVQFDNEFVGQDFSASLKAMSPSLMEGGLTGIFIGSYLQSVTPSLAVGFEGVWQRAALNVRPETVMSYCARYKSADWVASAQYLAQGSLGGSYWRRLTDKVEAGVDCQLQFAPGMGGNGMFGGMRKEGTTTVGVKYNFLASVYRAQIDSAGKVGVVLEKRIAPPITLTFAAEIDQWKVLLRPFSQ